MCRWILGVSVGGFALASGCADVECGEGTHLEDGICVVGEAFDSANPPWDPTAPHPNVPDNYQGLWKTDGCVTGQGRDADQLYRLLTGRADASGHFVGTEKFYWFFTGDEWDGDCIDEFDVIGDYVEDDYGTWGCEGCEQGFELELTLAVDNCDQSYNWILPNKVQGENRWTLRITLDSLNAFGGFQENNNMLVFTRRYNNRNQTWGLSQLTGGQMGPAHWFPDSGLTDEPYYPASYDWLVDDCQGDWGN